MQVFIALVLGVLAYLVASLVFSHPISVLIGVVVAAFYYFGFDRSARR